MSVNILIGDCRERLRELPDASVNCCVTSPPYYSLRDYGMSDQIGLEPSVGAFVSELVSVFRQVRRVMRDDGTLWVNIGDSYAGDKQLLGVPWKLAEGLRADGWILRQDIIWSKPNPMPESVRDRCTKAHEYIFLLSKGHKYYYDAEAIAEDHADSNASRLAALKAHGDGAVGKWVPGAKHEDDPHFNQKDHRGLKGVGTTFGKFNSGGRNRRSVWTVAAQPFSEAHFATYPPALIEPCILAGCPKGGTVLDPFGGAGTTGMVADRLGRDAVLIELNPEYAEIARKRLAGDGGMFADVKVAA